MQFKAIWADNSPASKFLIALGILIIGAFIFTFVSLGLSSAIYGIDIMQLQELMNDFENPLTISVLKLIQTVSAIGTFILPALFLAYTFGNSATGYLHLDRKVRWESVVIVFILLVAAVPLINFLGEWNSRMQLPAWMEGFERRIRANEDQAALLTEKFLSIGSPLQLINTILLFAVIPAVSEELMFRGILQRIFSEWSGNKHTAVWASAILFSAMHNQFYGFVPRMLLGVMLGYLLLWSGSLWLPIIAHFINNGAAVIAIYLYRHNELSINPDKIGTESEWTTVLISTVLTSGLLWLIYKREKSARGYVD
jgi:membrane protease YdiL (CAAX protease family)